MFFSIFQFFQLKKKKKKRLFDTFRPGPGAKGPFINTLVGGGGGKSQFWYVKTFLTLSRHYTETFFTSPSNVP